MLGNSLEDKRTLHKMNWFLYSGCSSIIILYHHASLLIQHILLRIGQTGLTFFENYHILGCSYILLPNLFKVFISSLWCCLSFIHVFIKILLICKVEPTNECLTCLHEGMVFTVLQMIFSCSMNTSRDYAFLRIKFAFHCSKNSLQIWYRLSINNIKFEILRDYYKFLKTSKILKVYFKIAEFQFFNNLYAWIVVVSGNKTCIRH